MLFFQLQQKSSKSPGSSVASVGSPNLKPLKTTAIPEISYSSSEDEDFFDAEEDDDDDESKLLKKAYLKSAAMLFTKLTTIVPQSGLSNEILYILAAQSAHFMASIKDQLKFA